jgi:shikimate 5-dehydrogenase
LILGAGGAGTALTWHLTQGAPVGDRPARIHLVDCIPARLEHLQRLHAAWPGATPIETHVADIAAAADRVMSRLPAGSLVANATGAGKDTPGSPLTGAAVFPERGLAWEFNYRGELLFLEQARAQQPSRSLQVVDGWTYFLHGWTRVIADVFDCDIPPQGSLFEELGAIAARTR